MDLIFPDVARRAFQALQQPGLIPHFTLSALDKDGFARMDIEVALHEMSILAGDSKDQPPFIYLSHRATAKCEPQTYRRVRAWDIMWNF
jgi:hypothetical protein